MLVVLVLMRVGGGSNRCHVAGVRGSCCRDLRLVIHPFLPSPYSDPQVSGLSGPGAVLFYCDLAKPFRAPTTGQASDLPPWPRRSAAHLPTSYWQLPPLCGARHTISHSWTHMHDPAARTTASTIQNEQPHEWEVHSAAETSGSFLHPDEKTTGAFREVICPPPAHFATTKVPFSPKCVSGRAQRLKGGRAPFARGKPTKRAFCEVLRERARQAGRRVNGEAPGRAEPKAPQPKSFERGPTRALPELAASRLFPPPLPGAVRE